MKISFRSLATVALLPLGFTTVYAGTDFRSLESDVAELKAYEKRINQLETRIKDFENENQEAHHSFHQMEENSKEALSVAYSSQAAAEEAKQEAEILYRSFEDKPWRSPAVTSGEGFEFHGSFRSSYGVNSHGGAEGPKANAFKAPGAETKYRLGNEPETKTNLTFAYNFENPEWKKEGINVKTQVTMTIDTESNAAFDYTGTKLSLADCFAEIDGVWADHQEAKFWAGQRLYKGHGVYINNFTFLDGFGLGGGMYDLEACDGKVGIAYIGTNDRAKTLQQAGKISKNTLDMRYYDFEMPYGTGTLALSLSGIKGGVDQSTGDTYKSAQGFGLSFIHLNRDFFSGSNQFVLQYGKGPSNNFKSVIQDPKFFQSNAWTFRAIEAFTLEPNENFSIETNFVYEVKQSGLSNDNKQTWYSIGSRPIYHFNKFWGVALEGGIDHVRSGLSGVDSDGNTNTYQGTLYKLTLAPEVKPEVGFLVRPTLRAYVTYAWWTKQFESRIGGPAYTGKRHGLVAGVQAEARW
tara:strand:+ start:1154 stop:2716 length:1563 start_codon:yes stop_codon:yes gene_type:complete